MKLPVATESVCPVHPPPVRLLVVEDHAILRAGLTAILNAEPDLAVVAEATSAEGAVAAFRRVLPDVTLIALQLAGGGDGLVAIEQIREVSARARFVVLTAYEADESLVRAVQAGAGAYLLKDTEREELLRAIRAVAAGVCYLHPHLALRLTARLTRRELSARETAVLRLIAVGLGNKQISDQLSIAETTVKTHVGSILGKLGVENRTQAAAYALQSGILT